MKPTPEQVAEIRAIFDAMPEAERIRKASVLLQEAAVHAAKYLGSGPVAAASFNLFFELCYREVGPDRMREWFSRMERTIEKYADAECKTH